MHELLETAWQHLYYPDKPGCRYICYALSDAHYHEQLTWDEFYWIKKQVLYEVHQLAPTADFLLHAAIMRGFVPAGTEPTDPVYIQYRDQWLQNMIERYKEKYEAVSIAGAGNETAVLRVGAP